MNGGEMSVTNLSTLSSSVWQKLWPPLEAQRDASSVLKNLTKVPEKLIDPDHPRPRFRREDSSVLVYQHRPAPPGHRHSPLGLPSQGPARARLTQRPGPRRGAAALSGGGSRSASPRAATCRSWDCKSSPRWGWTPAWPGRAAATRVPPRAPLPAPHASIRILSVFRVRLGGVRRWRRLMTHSPRRKSASFRKRKWRGWGFGKATQWRGGSGAALFPLHIPNVRKTLGLLSWPRCRGPQWGRRCWPGDRKPWGLDQGNQSGFVFFSLWCFSNDTSQIYAL